MTPYARDVQRAVSPPLASSPAPHTRFHAVGHAPTTGMMLPVRIFLAAGWLRAGAEKLIDRSWWTGSVLRGFLKSQHDDAVPFFRPVMDHVIAPAAVVVAITVVVTQLLCGLLIGTGFRMRLALRWAFFMNVIFMLAGRVNPSAFYLVMELAMLFAIADGALGVNPSTPSRRTMAAAGMSAVLAALFIPYIRTIEPAKVIEDPAMMLAFLFSVLAATLVLRRASHPTYQHTRIGQLWVRRLSGLIHAQPPTLAEQAVTASRFESTVSHSAGHTLPLDPEESEESEESDDWAADEISLGREARGRLSGKVIVALYVLATCGLLLLSSYRPVLIFGAANLVVVGVHAWIASGPSNADVRSNENYSVGVPEASS